MWHVSYCSGAVACCKLLRRPTYRQVCAVTVSYQSMVAKMTIWIHLKYIRYSESDTKVWHMLGKQTTRFTALYTGESGRSCSRKKHPLPVCGQWAMTLDRSKQHPPYLPVKSESFPPNWSIKPELSRHHRENGCSSWQRFALSWVPSRLKIISFYSWCF